MWSSVATKKALIALGTTALITASHLVTAQECQSQGQESCQLYLTGHTSSKYNLTSHPSQRSKSPEDYTNIYYARRLGLLGQRNHLQLQVRRHRRQRHHHFRHSYCLATPLPGHHRLGEARPRRYQRYWVQVRRLLVPWTVLVRGGLV